jgi:ABC-type branched-subunit amino acid transport system substrate-binding protein
MSERTSRSSAMGITRRTAVAGALAVAVTMPARLRAQEKTPLRIGVLNDQSGPFADLSGLGSVEAARLAIEDHGGRANGVAVELLAADHQNKPDIGIAILRKWLDVDNVQAVFDLGNSAISLAAQQIMRERNRIIVHSTSATSDLTGSACSPVGFHWVYDTYSSGAGIAKALMGQGLDTWFFITVDYAFGKSIEGVARAAIEGAGGKVVGAVRHPLNTSDFSSYLLQAQASNAKVIVFANVGLDLSNCIKQAAEFRLSKVAGGSQTIVAPVMLLTDVHAIGLKLAQGLRFISGFYWDKDDETRAWSKRLFRAPPGDADHVAGGRLLRRPALSEGRGCGQDDGRSRRRGGDARNSGVGYVHQKRDVATRRAARSRHAAGRGQIAGRIEISMGLLQDRGRIARRPGIQTARGWRLSAGSHLIELSGSLRLSSDKTNPGRAFARPG